MKRIVSILFFTFLFFKLTAQDYYLLHAYSGTPMIKYSSSSTRVEKEDVHIILEEDHYVVESKLYINNKKETENVEIVIPKDYASSDMEEIIKKFNDFTVRINNIDYEFSSQTLYNSGDFKEFYVGNISLPGGETTILEVKYSTPYSHADIQHIVNYIYGTGSKWNQDPWWDIHFTIENRAEKWIHGILLYKAEDISYESNITKFTLTPNRGIPLENKLMMWVCDQTVLLSHEMKLKYFRSDELQLSLLSDLQLRILRNSFYARYGYIFKSEELNNLFSQYEWYNPNQDFSEDMFSDEEKDKINKIYDEERKRSN